MLTSLTRSMSRLSIQRMAAVSSNSINCVASRITPALAATATTSTSCINTSWWQTTTPTNTTGIRWMSGNSSDDDEGGDDTNTSDDPTDDASLDFSLDPPSLPPNKKNLSKREKKVARQHQAWVDFQSSISVPGFETGQTLTTSGAGKRKRLKLNKLEEKIIERQRMVGTGGGEFPPMRYSEAETERLLKEAWDWLPKRKGKRGTRHLKRQASRWEQVRAIHAKKKAQVEAAHYRRMADRSRIAKECRAMRENASSLRLTDLEYQKRVYMRHMIQLGLKEPPQPPVDPSQQAN